MSGALTLARTRVEWVIEALRAIDDDRSTDVAARKQRALEAAGSLADDLAGALVVPSSDVAWVEGDERAVTLKVAPVDAGEVLRASLWARTTAVLTSATIPIGLPAAAAHEELAALIEAAGGRTLDVPGPSLNLVTIDRIPFPRPDEPLLQARREQARADAFRIVDLPRATTLLAQGAGRLIRSRRDRGVVAMLDPRLATNQRYRWDIIRALPPMRRTRDRTEAERFLRALDTPADRR